MEPSIPGLLFLFSNYIYEYFLREVYLDDEQWCVFINILDWDNSLSRVTYNSHCFNKIDNAV